MQRLLTSAASALFLIGGYGREMKEELSWMENLKFSLCAFAPLREVFREYVFRGA